MINFDFKNKFDLLQVSFDSFINELERDEILFAIIFGSFARDSDHDNSDIDIAIFSGRDKQQNFKLQMKYASKFEKLSNKKLDIVFLDHSSLILAHRVIKDGLLLFENHNHQGSYKKFKEFVISRYPDFHYTIFSQLKNSTG
jgi:predicted nucleotidyltransferase